MKKILAFLLIISLVLLSSCGEKSGQNLTADELSARFDELLASDYDVYYYLFFGGLQVDYADEQDGYYAVTDETLGSMEKVTAWLSDIYSEKAVARILNETDESGQLLLKELGGKLYRSSSSSDRTLPPDVVEGSASFVQNTESDLMVTFTTLDDNGSESESKIGMVYENKAWKLDSPRCFLEQTVTLIQEQSTETADEIAERFTKALLEADTDAIEYCAGEPEGTYAAWAGIDVKEASIVSLEDENETMSEYLVDLSVGNAYGLLTSGKSTYRMMVEKTYIEEDTYRPVVTYFEPETNNPYNFRSLTEQTDEACNLVMKYLDLYGDVSFGSLEKWSGEQMTEFALYLLDLEGTGTTVFDEETVRRKMEQIYNTSVQPDESFYSEQEGGYVFMGRAGSGQWYELSESQQWSDHVTVGVDMYTDHLQTQGHTWLTFTLKENSDGSYYLVKAIR